MGYFVCDSYPYRSYAINSIPVCFSRRMENQIKSGFSRIEQCVLILFHVITIGRNTKKIQIDKYGNTIAGHLVFAKDMGTP